MNIPFLDSTELNGVLLSAANFVRCRETQLSAFLSSASLHQESMLQKDSAQSRRQISLLLLCSSLQHPETRENRTFASLSGASLDLSVASLYPDTLFALLCSAKKQSQRFNESLAAPVFQAA
jgi:hypothetical protein